MLSVSGENIGGVFLETSQKKDVLLLTLMKTNDFYLQLSNSREKLWNNFFVRLKFDWFPKAAIILVWKESIRLQDQTRMKIFSFRIEKKWCSVL